MYMYMYIYIYIHTHASMYKKAAVDGGRADWAGHDAAGAQLSSLFQ